MSKRTFQLGRSRHMRCDQSTTQSQHTDSANSCSRRGSRTSGVLMGSSFSLFWLGREPPSPSIERTATGKPASAPHVKRLCAKQGRVIDVVAINGGIFVHRGGSQGASSNATTRGGAIFLRRLVLGLRARAHSRLCAGI